MKAKDKLRLFLFFIPQILGQHCNALTDFYKVLALFPAHELAICIPLTDSEIMDDSMVALRGVDDSLTDHSRSLQQVFQACLMKRDLIWRSHALVIEQQCLNGEKMNAAAHVTEPSLTLIQQVCYQKANLDGIFIQSLVKPEDFSIAWREGRCRHMLVNNHPFKEFPVVCNMFKTTVLPQKDKMEFLVVLTGNGNDRYLRSSGYQYVITVTWGGDHKNIPHCLPDYLLAVKEALSVSFAGPKRVEVDVLGLSRGHCALMSCCKLGKGTKHIELACAFRSFIGAGGCIWQAGNDGIVDEVLKGLVAMKQAYSSRYCS